MGNLEGGTIEEEVHDAVGVAPLIVVPRDELDKGLVKSDTGLGVEGGGSLAADEVRGDDVLVGVGDDALELALRGLLDGGADLLVGGGSLELAGEVDDRDIEGGHTEGHAGELAENLGDDLADSLGSAGGRGDDVARGSAAVTPGLGRGAVDGLLGGGDGVDGGHEATDDAELVVDDLDDGGKAVGGARGVGDDGLVGSEGLVVDTIDEHGCIGRGSGDQDLLGAASDVGLSLGDGGEGTRGLDDPLDAVLAPGDLLGVLAGSAEDLVGLALVLDGELVVLALDLAFEAAVHSVVLVHVGHRLGLDEGIVDQNNVGGHATSDEDAENKTANATKTVDANGDHFLTLKERDVCFA